MLAAGQGGCSLSRAGIVITGPGRENNEGTPSPPSGWLLVGASSSHKAALLCVCLLGGQGNSFVCFCFPFSFLFFFSVWPLASPRLGSTRGGGASREGMEEPSGVRGESV